MYEAPRDLCLVALGLLVPICLMRMGAMMLPLHGCVGG